MQKSQPRKKESSIWLNSVLTLQDKHDTIVSHERKSHVKRTRLKEGMQMNPSTQSSQEIVMQELAKLSETQQEEVLSFIHSLVGKKSLTPRRGVIARDLPQDSQEVPSPSSATRKVSQRCEERSNLTATQQAPSESQSDEFLILIALKQFPKEKHHWIGSED